MSTELPFVGRSREIQIIERTIDDLECGTGAVLVVSGEAGAGKSTLIGKLLDWAWSRNIRGGIGYCIGSSGHAVLTPWFEMLRASTIDGASSENLFDIHATASGDRSRAIANQLRHVLDHGPLVAVIEDIQWADAESLELLTQCARWTRHLPLILCASYRTEVMHRGSAAYRAVPEMLRDVNGERISLKPLDFGAVQGIVKLAYSLPEEDEVRLARFLHQRSQGNPLYVSELLRGMHEAELIVANDQYGDRLDELDDFRVPAHLSQLIELRISQLGSVVREHLDVASVLGDQVNIDLWRRTRDVEPDELLQSIEVAAKAGILDPSEDGRTVWFHHNLVREVLYFGLLPPVRSQLHLRIAELLAGDAKSEPDQVAWHFQLAGDSRAIDWLYQAADRAQRAYAWTSAAARLEQVARLSPDAFDGDRGWLFYRIGRLLRHAEPNRAIQWLDDAHRLARRANDSLLSAICQFDRGHLQIFLGQLDRGLDVMTEAVSALRRFNPVDYPNWLELESWIADVAPDTSGPERAGHGGAAENVGELRLGTLVQWLAEAGRYEDALRYGEPFVSKNWEIERTSEQIVSSLGDAWYGLARAHAAFAEPNRALQEFERAAICYEQIEHHLLLAMTHRAQVDEVLIPFRTDDLEPRVALLQKAERALGDATSALGASIPPNVLALDTLILEGDWGTAENTAEGIALSHGVIEPLREAGLVRLVRVYRERARSDDARRLIEEILPEGPDTSVGTRGIWNVLYVAKTAAELALDGNDEQAARGWLAAIDRWVTWSQARAWRPSQLLLWARLYQLRRDAPAAKRHAQRALDQSTELGMPHEVGSAHLYLGALALTDRNLESAEKHLEEAGAIGRRSRAFVLQASTQTMLAKLRMQRGDREGALDIADALLERVRESGAVRIELEVKEMIESIAASIRRRERPFGLTAREMEVLRLVAEGMSDAEVADHLYISYRTVTTHLTSIFNKLGVNSRVSATRIAVENDLL